MLIEEISFQAINHRHKKSLDGILDRGISLEGNIIPWEANHKKIRKIFL